jgi:hypothetical protein
MPRGIASSTEEPVGENEYFFTFWNPWFSSVHCLLPRFLRGRRSRRLRGGRRILGRILGGRPGLGGSGGGHAREARHHEGPPRHRRRQDPVRGGRLPSQPRGQAAAELLHEERHLHPGRHSHRRGGDILGRGDDRLALPRRVGLLARGQERAKSSSSSSR